MEGEIVQGAAEGQAGGAQAAPPAAPTAPAAPAPNYVTADQFMALRGAVEAQAAQQNRLLEALIAQQQQAAQPAQAPEPDDEAIAAAYANGTLGKTFKQLVDRRVDRVIREHVEPLRAQGEAAIANLTLEVAKSKMPYFEQVRGDMEAFLSQMPTGVRANPQALQIAYDSAVGKNFKRLAEAETEGKLRQMAGATGGVAGTALPGGNNGRQAGGSKVPNALEAFGPAVAEAVRSKGGEDAFARTLRFKDWAEYYEATKEYR